MSETLTAQPNVAAPAVNEQAAPTVAPEVARAMQIALNGGLIPEETSTTETPQPETTTVVADPFNVFKEKFGYQAPEDAIREIEELRAFKSAPPVSELEFENEDSAKLFRAWQAGKKDEVYNYLEKERKISNYLSKEVNESTAADIVKLNMQLKNRDLTQQEIDWKFNRQYAIPSKPIQGAEEDEAQYKERVASWEAIVADKKMELLIDAKVARPEIEAANSKLVLPDIDQQVDQDYLNYKQSVEENSRLAVETEKAYQSFTPETIETKLDFKDEANKINFQFQYKPSAEDFKKAQALTSDIDQFWKYFFKPDGSPDRQKFLKAVTIMTNEEKYLMEAMNQAKNATIKAMLPDNSQGGLVRQLGSPFPQEKSEVDKEMELRGIKRG